MCGGELGSETGLGCKGTAEGEVHLRVLTQFGPLRPVREVPEMGAEAPHRKRPMQPLPTTNTCHVGDVPVFEGGGAWLGQRGPRCFPRSDKSNATSSGEGLDEAAVSPYMGSSWQGLAFQSGFPPFRLGGPREEEDILERAINKFNPLPWPRGG